MTRRRLYVVGEETAPPTTRAYLRFQDGSIYFFDTGSALQCGRAAAFAELYSHHYPVASQRFDGMPECVAVVGCPSPAKVSP